MVQGSRRLTLVSPLLNTSDKLIQLQLLEGLQKAFVFPADEFSGFAGISLEIHKNDSVQFPLDLRKQIAARRRRLLRRPQRYAKECWRQVVRLHDLIRCHDG